MKEKGKDNIISFYQKAPFYLKVGDKRLDEGDPYSAFDAYRKAMKADPKNADACLAAAEVLYQLKDYEGSNRLLMVYNTMYEPVAEAFFGLACNFYGMSEFDYAIESLETYLKLDPDGSYAYEAEDFLDLLDDDDDLADALFLEEDEDFDTLTICTRAQHLLNCGKPEIAEELLREHLTERMDSRRARDMLTTALYAEGKFEEAKRINDQIIKVCSKESADPTLGKLNHVLLMIHDKKEEEAVEELERLEKIDPENVDFQCGIAGLYMMLGCFGAARSVLESTFKSELYDKKALGMLAYCLVMTEDDERAAECYEKLLKLDPFDPVARYYSTYVRNREPDNDRRRFFLPMQLPVLETLLNMKRVAEYCGMDKAALREAWKDGNELQALLYWVFALPDDRIKRSGVAILTAIGNEETEYMLRDLILRTDQTDELKREIFACLKQLNAKEPFAAYLESQWMQGTITTVNLPKELPQSYQSVITMFDRYVIKKPEHHMMCMRALELFMSVVNDHDGCLPRLKKDAVPAFAAAIEYAASVQTGTPFEKDEISGRYGTTERRMLNAVKKLDLMPAEE